MPSLFGGVRLAPGSASFCSSFLFPLGAQVQSSFDQAMRKAALIYNPDSGGKSAKRRSQVESALALLRNGGVDAELVLTESRHHAGEATQRAMDAGCDTIFACGGDGTIHNIAQVLANSPVALAILPMGTANALAHDLGLPRNIIGAAKAALHGKPRRVAMGCVNYVNLNGSPASRYFLVAAGVGVDAHLFYKLHNRAKQSMGMAAYYAKAWNLWFTYAMTRFVAEYIENGSSETHRAEVTELLSVRIRNFGGAVQELAPGASLDRNDMRLVFAQTASRLAYLAWVTRGMLRQRWKIPGVVLAHSTRVSCTYRTASSAESESQRKVYIEADGELLGTLPVEITVVPDALALLAPAR
jgi:diacylglycerol kinase (ATP)